MIKKTAWQTSFHLKSIGIAFLGLANDKGAKLPQRRDTTADREREREGEILHKCNRQCLLCNYPICFSGSFSSEMFTYFWNNDPLIWVCRWKKKTRFLIFNKCPLIIMAETIIGRYQKPLMESEPDECKTFYWHFHLMVFQSELFKRDFIVLYVTEVSEILVLVESSKTRTRTRTRWNFLFLHFPHTTITGNHTTEQMDSPLKTLTVGLREDDPTIPARTSTLFKYKKTQGQVQMESQKHRKNTKNWTESKVGWQKYWETEATKTELTPGKQTKSIPMTQLN